MRAVHLRQQVALLLFFAGIGFLALFPLLLQLRSHIPGDRNTDYFHFHWSYWWARHALSTPGLSLYESSYVMFPYTTNLAYHTLAVFWLPLWALLEPIIGTVGAVNLIFWAALTLTGYSMYHLLRREGVPVGLALLTGVAVEVSPQMLRAVWWTNPNLLGIFWFPVHLLIWGELARRVNQVNRERGTRFKASLHVWGGVALYALLQGLAIWGAILTDIQYGMFIPFLLLPYVLLTLIQSRQRWQLILWGMIALLIGVGLLWFAGPLPALLNYDEGQVLRASLENSWGIPFPAGYLSSDEDYWLIARVGGVVTAAVIGALLYSLIRTSPPVLLSIHSEGAWTRWFWLGLVIVPLLLSPGKAILLNGREIAMPYQLYHALTGGLFRFPERFGIVLLIPAFLFAGLTFAPVWQRRRPHPILTAMLLCLILWNLRTLQPIATQLPPPAYDFYRSMGAEPYDYVVIEAPTAAGSAIQWIGNDPDMAFQYYGVTHGKRMINGHFTRVPTAHWYYLLTDDPLLSWLGQRRNLEPEVVEAQLTRIIPEYPVGYLVLHQDHVGRERGANEDILGYLNSLPHLFCAPLVEGEAVAYRTTWHPDGCSTDRTPPQSAPDTYFIDIGTAGDERFLGRWWYWPEQIFDITLRWTGELPQVDLYVDVPPASYTLTIAMQAFDQPRQVTVLLNNQTLATVEVTPEALQEYTFTLPADQVGDGQQLHLTLAYDSWAVPAEIGQGSNTRRLAIAVDWLTLTRD